MALGFWSIPPDALWYVNTEGPLYVMLGGRNNRAGQRLSGASGLSLNHFSNYISVEGIVGASNKYTPDVFTWNKDAIFYATSGGRNGADYVHCGAYALALYNHPGHSYWSFGASSPRFNQYNILEVLS